MKFREIERFILKARGCDGLLCQDIKGAFKHDVFTLVWKESSAKYRIFNATIFHQLKACGPFKNSQ